MTSHATNGSKISPLSRNIKAARQAAGLTQRELAIRLGLTDLTVSRWERDFAVPGKDNLSALAYRLGVDIAWLYTDHEEAA